MELKIEICQLTEFISARDVQEMESKESCAMKNEKTETTTLWCIIYIYLDLHYTFTHAQHLLAAAAT